MKPSQVAVALLNVDDAAAKALRAAVVSVHGHLRGHLCAEASEAIRAHAERLRLSGGTQP